MRGRRLAMIATAGAGAVLLTASTAWACTNFIRIENVSPATLQPSASASVRGVDAVAGSTVELRWNKLTGPVLAVAQADAYGAFAAEVQVPNVTPGLYVLTATSEGHVARSAIQVGVATVAGQTSVAPTNGGEASNPGTTGAGLLAAGLLLMASAAVVLAARRRPVRVPARTATRPDAGSHGAESHGAKAQDGGRVGPGALDPSSSAGDRLDDLVEVGR